LSSSVAIFVYIICKCLLMCLLFPPKTAKVYMVKTIVTIKRKKQKTKKKASNNNNDKKKNSVNQCSMPKQHQFYTSYSKFLFKNRIISTFFGLIADLLAATTSPALENCLSDGTDVPGIHKYFLARSCNCGRWKEFCFHQ